MKTILSLSLALLAFGSHAQGLVNFDTRVIGPTAQAFSYDGSSLLSGTEYYAQLYAADGQNAAVGSLVAVGNPVNFQTGPNAGYVVTARGTIPTGAGNNVAVEPWVGVTGVSGGPVTLQLRAWPSTFATYAAAVGGGGIVGCSPLLNLAATLNPPGTPPNLVGLQGFVLATPEPSTFALLGLGVAGLLVGRRTRRATTRIDLSGWNSSRCDE